MLKNLGLFGGSFDPFHTGHSHVINEVSKSGYIESLLLIPNYQSPHKSDPHYHANDRVKKIQEALPTFPKNLHIEICDWEIRQGKPCWTIDTINYISTHYTYDSLFFIMGSDSFFSFHTWKNVSEIAKQVSLLVIRRDNKPLENYHDYQKNTCPETRLIVLGEGVVDISSTQLKRGMI